MILVVNRIGVRLYIGQFLWSQRVQMSFESGFLMRLHEF